MTQGEYTLFRVTQEWIGQDGSLWVTLWMEPGTGVLYRARAALTALRVSYNYKYTLFYISTQSTSQRNMLLCSYSNCSNVSFRPIFKNDKNDILL